MTDIENLRMSTKCELLKSNRFLTHFRINLIYGTVCEQCTETSCPTMSGGPKFEYLWQDGVKYKKPTHLPAPQVRLILLF